MTSFNLTYYICKDPIFKSNLRFWVDMNLGMGGGEDEDRHYSTQYSYQKLLMLYGTCYQTKGTSLCSGFGNKAEVKL